MSNDNERENFDHAKAGVGDRIAVVGEMEHLRRHALRSAISSEEGSELAFSCLVWAKQLQDMRREYMRKHFGEIDDKLWCMCKSAACLRQLAYEVDGDDVNFLKEVDNLVDDIWGTAVNKDLSDCESCRSDREEVQ
jgi:hypothetical protein